MQFLSSMKIVTKSLEWKQSDLLVRGKCGEELKWDKSIAARQTVWECNFDAFSGILESEVCFAINHSFESF
jgi:hypothetical protein